MWALRQAVRSGNFADMNARDEYASEYGDTPFETASIFGHHDIVQLLLRILSLSYFGYFQPFYTELESRGCLLVVTPPAPLSRTQSVYRELPAIENARTYICQGLQLSLSINFRERKRFSIGKRGTHFRP
jgi:ankyrin repeat protein